jgi:hypothetical protein
VLYCTVTSKIEFLNLKPIILIILLILLLIIILSSQATSIHNIYVE